MSKTKNKPGIHLYRTEHYTGGVDYTWYWHIVASNGRIIARSSETYSRKAGAVNSLRIASQIFRLYTNSFKYYDHSKPGSPLKSYL